MSLRTNFTTWQERGASEQVVHPSRSTLRLWHFEMEIRGFSRRFILHLAKSLPNMRCNFGVLRLTLMAPLTPFVSSLSIGILLDKNEQSRALFNHWGTEKNLPIDLADLIQRPCRIWLTNLLLFPLASTARFGCAIGEKANSRQLTSAKTGHATDRHNFF